jgi:hypothetical protein
VGDHAIDQGIAALAREWPAQVSGDLWICIHPGERFTIVIVPLPKDQPSGLERFHKCPSFPDVRAHGNRAGAPADPTREARSHSTDSRAVAPPD